MATEKDLINAVRESLKEDGKLGRVKAEMCSEVIALLSNSTKENETRALKTPLNVIFVNELIREYLDWMGYKYSRTVFVSECDLSKHCLDRTLLLQNFGLKDGENSSDLPILCSILETFKSLQKSA